jgi:hypothetical protein
LGREGSSPFLRKRTKKLLLLVLPALAHPFQGALCPYDQKFFASFFQKKKRFLLCYVV